jgi:hypothetical protein
MQFGLKNAPSEFQKQMEDVFRDLAFVIIYIDDLLVCSLDIKKHKNYFHKIYEDLYKHGIYLSKMNIKFAKTRIEYLGLIIVEEKIELQEHVLKSLQNFPNETLDQRKLQIFLGCLNYIRQFYEQQVKDAKILQRKLRGKIAWNYRMTATIQIIKQKVHNLPKLHLPSQALPFI